MRKTYFIYGGLQGFAIGCLAGLGIGAISAFQAKRLLVIPISMLFSGMFFACVMAFGSLIRSADNEFMGKTESKLKEEYALEEYIQKYRTLCSSSIKTLIWWKLIVKIIEITKI